MITPQSLADDWLRLLGYCNSPDFDRASFKNYHDSVASKYKKLNYQEQGEFTAIVLAAEEQEP